MDRGNELINLTDKKREKDGAQEQHRVLDNRLNKLVFTKRILEVVVGILVAVVIVLLAVVIYLVTVKSSLPPQFCDYQDSDYVTPRNFEDPEPFDDLTPAEYKSVLAFMLNNAELDLTPFDKATPNSNYVLSVTLFLPKKKEYINYSDNGGAKPARKALVLVIRGNSNPPGVQEYIVSPLPKPKSVDLYKNPSFRRHPIPYTSRPMDNVHYAPLYKEVITPASEKLFPLLMESYGRCFHNCSSKQDCILFYDTGPHGLHSGERNAWVRALADHDGGWMHPLGLEMMIDMKSNNFKQWTIKMIVYNGQKFDSVNSLMQAYEAKTLKMIDMRNDDLSYSTYGAKGSVFDPPIQGPRLFEPDGKRFRVAGQHVTYGKWSFHYHMSVSTGLQIFDVKFDGSRVAYEISLQEVLVMYTGYGPSQTISDFYDVSWFLGQTEWELARGVDCPETAVFFDTYNLANAGNVKKVKNNVCIFENNGAIPARRHYDNDYYDGYGFYGGLADYHLIIRAITTSGNYDYIFDYIFYNNGVIEVKATATGYVMATFRLPEEEQYGGIINNQVMADLHTHLVNYKIDIDIEGVGNRYMTLDVGLESIKDPWNDNKNLTQMKITKNHINKESVLGSFKSGVPQYHIIYSNNSRNAFGSAKGYRILNKDYIPFLEKDRPLSRGAKWANYPIVVTLRKEGEQSSSTMYAQHDPYDPVVDLSDFIDGDNLVDEDLVAWVTTGTYHIPGTEDVPSTPTTWNQYSVFLAPHNYFDECPSVRSRDNVLIVPSEGGSGAAKTHTYGRKIETKCVPKSEGPTNYDGVRHVV